MVLEKTLESPLDCKEIQPVHPKGDQFWVFSGMTDAKAETPILWSVSQFSRSVMSDSVTPWIAARQASLFITNSRSLLKLISIQSVMPSSHLILCRPLLLLTPFPPSIRVFSNESTLPMRWPKYWASLVAQTVKNLPAMQKTQVQFLGQKEAL